MSGSKGINGVGGQPAVGGAGQNASAGLGEGKGVAEGVVGGIAGRAGEAGRGGGQGPHGPQGQQGNHGNQGGPRGSVDHSGGPGRSGQGNAYGNYKHDNDGGTRGPRGGGNDGRPAQLLADEPRVQQLRHRLESQQTQLRGNDGAQFNPGRGRELGGDNRFTTHGPPDIARPDNSGRGNNNNLRPPDLSSSIESFTRAAGNALGRNAGDGPASLLFRVGEGREHGRGVGNAFGHEIGRGHGNAFGHGLNRSGLGDAAAAYLRGLNDGASLPPSTRAALDAVKQALGPSAASALSDKETGKILRLVERALEHVGRTTEHAAGRGHDFVHGDGRGPSVRERFGNGFTPGSSPEHLARELADELLGAAILARHLKRLEGKGGAVVRQAEEMIARLLYGRGGAESGRGPQPAPGPQPHPAPEPRLHPQEFLRDLREGVFVPRQEQYNPFPLTGRARVVAEMMELMRTLDAVEGALRQAAASRAGAAAANADKPSHVGALLKAYFAGTLGAALDELLALLNPTLPGRAARMEIPRAVAAMNGLLTDADGHALVARDGTPLKLDRLVWLNAAGGLLGTAGLASSFAAESFPTRLNPLLVYGFDAVYSVIGFDGRTLAAPHFVAVQSAANDAESEWVFGQQPLSAGWVRELVERLKDSAPVEHNLLGEMLEEAWADGRFHVALLNVSVEEGAPVPESHSVTRLLPGASGELAFA
ncbi:MAG TPA: hypothetical protein VER32_13590 [Pyrinomonadaceae bacterium]|nr:hypothetical protein [Pyrinomonadaceae bacterium]